MSRKIASARRDCLSEDRAHEGPPRENSSSTTAPIQVLVAEPSSVLRPVLAHIIGAEADMTLSGQAATAAEAFELLAQARPHVAVVDISLEDAHGLDLVQNLQAQHPEVQVVVFSMCDERVYAERAVRAGAAGYVMKTAPTADLMSAIRTAARRDVYLSRRVSSQLMSQLVRSRREGHASDLELQFGIDELTRREMEVFQLAGDGKTTAEIATHLDLTTRMVNVHQRRIRRKLDLGDQTEMRQFAVQWVMADQHV